MSGDQKKRKEVICSDSYFGALRHSATKVLTVIPIRENLYKASIIGYNKIQCFSINQSTAKKMIGVV